MKIFLSQANTALLNIKPKTTINRSNITPQKPKTQPNKDTFTPSENSQSKKIGPIEIDSKLQAAQKRLDYVLKTTEDTFNEAQKEHDEVLKILQEKKAQNFTESKDPQNGIKFTFGVNLMTMEEYQNGTIKRKTEFNSNTLKIDSISIDCKKSEDGNTFGKIIYFDDNSKPQFIKKGHKDLKDGYFDEETMIFHQGKIGMWEKGSKSDKKGNSSSKETMYFNNGAIAGYAINSTTQIQYCSKDEERINYENGKPIEWVKDAEILSDGTHKAAQTQPVNFVQRTLKDYT